MAVHRHSPSPRPLVAPDSIQFSERTRFLGEVLAGLRHPQKELPCKYFYDDVGSLLFDQICDQPDYYPTRTELAIMRRHASEMGLALGAGCKLIEFGSGSSLKTPLLLTQLARPVVYVPVDISGPHLLRSAAIIAKRFPEIVVMPVAADFTQPLSIPDTCQPVDRQVVYFPGSTIGNFAPAEARQLLMQIRELIEPNGALLIGVDLKKDVTVLTQAYNDRAGITAAFNMNLLTRMNRELGADFDLHQFEHHAFYNAEFGRVEMHLVSQGVQSVTIAGNVIPFRAGETIHTENSHKYTLDEFAGLARQAGLNRVKTWSDPQNYFSVQLFGL